MTWLDWQKPTRRTRGWGVEIDVGRGTLSGIKITASGQNAGELDDDFLARLDVGAMRRRARGAAEPSREILGRVRQSPAYHDGRRPRPEVEQGRARAEHDRLVRELDAFARERGVNPADLVASTYRISAKTAYRWLLDARRANA